MGMFDRKPNVEKLEARRDVEGLMKALRYDKNWSVREEATSALGDIADARAIEPLIKALEDEDRDVREEAAEALIKIGDERAVDPLIQYLEGAEE